MCGGLAGIRRMGSVKTRKVSTQSLQSTVSAEDTVLTTFVNIDDTAAAAAAAAPDTPYDEQGQDTQTDLRDASDELEYCRNMPWIKVLYDGSVLLVDEGLRWGLEDGAGVSHQATVSAPCSSKAPMDCHCRTCSEVMSMLFKNTTNIPLPDIIPAVEYCIPLSTFPHAPHRTLLTSSDADLPCLPLASHLTCCFSTTRTLYGYVSVQLSSFIMQGDYVLSVHT